MSPAWSFALARLLGVLAIATVAGFFLGQVAATVIAVLAGYLALSFVRLYRLERWLRRRRTESPPDFQGVWGDIVALIMRIYRRKQFHKRRIVQLFREFRRMTSAMPDGVVVLGTDREILWFNRNAGRLLRLRRKVDFGQRIDNLIRHPDFARYVELGDFSMPVVVRSSLDAEQHLALQMVAYGSQQLLLVRDVTRQVRLEAMRKDFVANASHELRSPLTVITGYVDTLAEDPGVDPLWRGPLEEMRRQSERMRAVVDALIELSRLESTAGEAGQDLIDVSGMLTLIRREVLALERHPSEVTLTLASDAKLLGSEAEVHSIFANLISNAVKYTPPEGRVAITWRVDADGAHFSVTDTGVGIAAEHIPRITERFYRVDPSRARTTGGSGLGLAIVKHALQRHGATLSIESEEGIGSTFSCIFPLRRVAARQPVAASG
ncbi:MAG TPA: phosphate regulon sensor histidine kinase PhoR [Steroidobacteraceae bacterium]|nr:phosphate regulon sensor histidine kinase PhoR [Steroidobacteraceae bacterium]